MADVEKISITIDAWTSPMKQDFLGVTAHWIDEQWKQQEMVLGFESLSGPHTGENLSAALICVLDTYGVGAKVFTITSDNASNMYKMMTVFERHCLNVGW